MLHCTHGLLSTQKIIIFSIIGAILQECIYRAYLVKLIQDIIKNNKIVFLINVVIFTFLHIFYAQPEIMLPLACGGGIIFTYLYMKYPNLILVSCAHIILNFTALSYGFFCK